MKTSIIEVTTIWEAMVFFRGNITKASKHLGIDRVTLRGYLKPENRHKILVRLIRDYYKEIVYVQMINPRTNGKAKRNDD